MAISPRSFAKMSNIYTSLSVARDEIMRRWSDPVLRGKVEALFGDDLPEVFKGRPRLVMNRSVFTPNREIAYFLDVAREFDLEPLLLEYPDKFVARNPTKYHLCKMFFCDRNNCSDSEHRSIRVVDFNRHEGKGLPVVSTLWNQSLVDFHHESLFRKYPELNSPRTLYNFLDWFNRHRVETEYYFHYLSLFVCHGILFDNFMWDDEEEASFLEDKFIPSVVEVERHFGLKPLIYPLLPIEHERDHHWLYYDESERTFVKNKL